MSTPKRSTKWTFLLYKESMPKDYIAILNSLHVPFILSPWHNKDVDSETGELIKSHKHGAFYFDSLKSYDQVSTLIHERLNGPKYIEKVISTTGLYDYFTHANNPSKSLYEISDIESGCGFNLNRFLSDQDPESGILTVISLIRENDIQEFNQLVDLIQDSHPSLLYLIVNKTYFFSKILDSRRFSKL